MMGSRDAVAFGSARTGRSRAGRAAGMVLAATCLAAALPSRADAQSAEANVADKNANPTVNFTGNAKPNATGLSLVGEKVFNKPAEDYEISDKLLATRNPTATELPNMQAVIGDATNLLNPKNALNAAQQKAAANAFSATAAFRFLPVGKDFAQINKGIQALTAGPVKSQNKPGGGDASQETAGATADMKIVAKALSFKGTTTSSIAIAGKAIPNPMAVSYAVNIDPTPVVWNSVGTRLVTVDLSGTSLTALTSGHGGAAASEFGLSASFIDGTSDVTLPMSSSSPLFSLALSANSFNGGPTSGVADLSVDGFTAANDPGNLGVSDSLGGMGLTAVLADLQSQFVSVGGGEYDISGPFTISFTVGGSSDTSLLYIDQTEGAAAQVVPEPCSLVLASIGAAGIAGYVRLRKGRAAISS